MYSLCEPQIISLSLYVRQLCIYKVSTDLAFIMLMIIMNMYVCVTFIASQLLDKKEHQFSADTLKY